MLYSSTYKFVFSKSTKTASTSTEVALEYLITGNFSSGKTNSLLDKDGSRIGYRGSNPKEDPNFNTYKFAANHASLEEIRDLIGVDSFNSAFRISSIRNPYDRVVSAFHHFGKQKLSEYVEIKKSGNISKIKDNFSEFISNHPAAKYNGRQHFYCDSEMAIDHFVRMEEMFVDLSSVLKSLGVPSDIHDIIVKNIPAFKKTSRAESSLQLADYFTHETIEIVNNTYAEWFELGGYVLSNSVSELG